MGEGKKKKEKSGDGASDGECKTPSTMMGVHAWQFNCYQQQQLQLFNQLIF